VAGAAAWGFTSVQSRPCSRMGSKQHLACWPPAAQMSMKLLMPVGVVGAITSLAKVRNFLLDHSRREGWGIRTVLAVEVGKVEDISRAAEGSAS
jgi:hypothetical protein